ncbi:hypothetical protein HK405_005835, partial [Cladochytrium tenue]
MAVGGFWAGLAGGRVAADAATAGSWPTTAAAAIASNASAASDACSSYATPSTCFAGLVSQAGLSCAWCCAGDSTNSTSACIDAASSSAPACTQLLTSIPALSDPARTATVVAISASVIVTYTLLLFAAAALLATVYLKRGHITTAHAPRGSDAKRPRFPLLADSGLLWRPRDVEDWPALVRQPVRGLRAYDLFYNVPLVFSAAGMAAAYAAATGAHRDVCVTQPIIVGSVAFETLVALTVFLYLIIVLVYAVFGIRSAPEDRAVLTERDFLAYIETLRGAAAAAAAPTGEPDQHPPLFVRAECYTSARNVYHGVYERSLMVAPFKEEYADDDSRFHMVDVPFDCGSVRDASAGLDPAVIAAITGTSRLLRILIIPDFAFEARDDRDRFQALYSRAKEEHASCGCTYCFLRVCLNVRVEPRRIYVYRGAEIPFYLTGWFQRLMYS